MGSLKVLIFTSVCHRVLNSLNIPLSVETICVFTAPVFSAFASWATYLLTKVCLSPNMTSLVLANDFQREYTQPLHIVISSLA